ncbi:MAG: hypothetical protein QOI81_24 [Actinomycetota bacterium]|nr:hypothetical protein [Actinomycetota bacterium]
MQDMPRVIPLISYEDVGSAADWLARAFGFREPSWSWWGRGSPTCV